MTKLLYIYKPTEMEDVFIALSQWVTWSIQRDIDREKNDAESVHLGSCNARKALRPVCVLYFLAHWGKGYREAMKWLQLPLEKGWVAVSGVGLYSWLGSRLKYLARKHARS
jgi:hypothetical protein